MTKKPMPKKLSLSKTTLRQLGERALDQAAGGGPPNTRGTSCLAGGCTFTCAGTAC